MSLENQDARPRRWLQFGLRTLLVGMVVLAVALGWWCDRARRLRETLAALEALQVNVYWTTASAAGAVEHPMFRSIEPPMGPAWLGPEYLHSPTSVVIGHGASLEEVVPHLKGLPKLKAIYVTSNSAVARSLFQDMPGVELFAIRRGRCGDQFVEPLKDPAGGS